jgi:hypothetical protein
LRNAATANELSGYAGHGVQEAIPAAARAADKVFGSTPAEAELAWRRPLLRHRETRERGLLGHALWSVFADPLAVLRHERMNVRKRSHKVDIFFQDWLYAQLRKKRCRKLTFAGTSGKVKS